MVPRRDLAEANVEVNRLQAVAEVVRRHAGDLRYHPAAGMQTLPPPTLGRALGELRASLPRIVAMAEAFAREDAAPAAHPDSLTVREIERAHQAVRRTADLLRVALDVLEGALANPEQARLDAPYGLGAPRRVHPGAQATWVAERAEDLARELAYLTLVRANVRPITRPGPPSP